MKPLSVLTVSYGHGSVLRQNLSLAESLNKNFHLLADWHVVENSPSDQSDRLSENEPGFIVHAIQGETGKGISHHHATTLNALLRAAPLNRHVIILDPDFFLLVPNWAEVIPQFMILNQLSFFGVPWHPRHNENYRYFPAVHCFAFDSQRISAKDLDFTPQLDRLQWRKTRVAHLLHSLPAIGWRLTRSGWDTGTRVFERFHHCTKSAVVVPVYRPPIYQPNPVGALLDKLLPDRYCMYPKCTASYTTNGFKERGWISGKIPGNWESFVWQDRPFGLHVRRSYAYERRDQPAEETALPEIIAQLEQSSTDLWKTEFQN